MYDAPQKFYNASIDVSISIQITGDAVSETCCFKQTMIMSLQGLSLCKGKNTNINHFFVARSKKTTLFSDGFIAFLPYYARFTTCVKS